ncbi:hypothetical protein ACN42_g10540 [Penicillium freii]|uniref:Uncharacterized protein n=1 Tax=Penicillium freii TaxID=48697 RepID=A0A101M9V1_PENFR|nr:hypothetical protein ACN42_g10540 [Penicillium freii]
MEYQLEKIAEEIRNGSDTIYQRFGLGGDQRYYYNRSAAPEIANVAVFLASDLAIAISCQGEPRERTRIVSSSSPVSPEGSEWSGGGPCNQAELISGQRPWECESMRKMHGP